MDIRSHVEKTYQAQTEAFSNSPQFQAHETGKVAKTKYSTLLANISITHMQSPKILAFLFSISPPNSTDRVKQNLLEELGYEEAEESHPDLLRNVMKGAGFDDTTIKRLEQTAQEEIRNKCNSPMMYATIKEFGLHMLLEVSSFEWMLSRLATRMGDFFTNHGGCKKDDLLWFYFHAEKDIQHAEEALDTIVDYVDYYGISTEEVSMIIDVVFRENIYMKHYFPNRSLLDDQTAS